MGAFSSRLRNLLGHQDVVDDVNHAVAGFDIGGRNIGETAYFVGQHDFLVGADEHADFAALHGRGHLAAQGEGSCGWDFTGDHMIGQDLDQHGFVLWLDQCVERGVG